MTQIEKAVRDAAMALHDAIMAARKAGYRVDYPNQVEGLPGIPVSDTAKTHPHPIVHVSGGDVTPEVAAKATAAAQKAANKVVDKS